MDERVHGVCRSIGLETMKSRSKRKGTVVNLKLKGTICGRPKEVILKLKSIMNGVKMNLDREHYECDLQHYKMVIKKGTN